MKGLPILVALLLYILPGCSSQPESNLKLWYDTPATDWMTEALPLGNGYMGVMFFGGVETEQLQFSEGSLWSGGPGTGSAYNFGLREGAWQYLPEVRQLLDANKFEEAHKLANSRLTGVIHNTGPGSSFGDYGAQQTMGDLFITVENHSDPQNYRRELDLDYGEGRITYEIDGNRFSRTYFGSYPHRVMVYHLEGDEAVDYSIRLESPHPKLSEEYRDGVYFFKGKVEDNGMEFETFLKIETDGQNTFSDGVLKVSNAAYLTIYQGAATDYLMEYPDYKGADYTNRNRETLGELEGMSYDQVREEHHKDYRSLFSRVELTLGEGGMDDVPVDQRLVNYSKGIGDPGLEVLYFQYSRYLMISSSRPGTMPMHLQGKWNNSTNPPWACDYHMNINQQMLYWPAEVTNLQECHQPLFTYMQSLVEPGRQAAKEFFNARGWIVNTMNNAFGFTSPGWDFPWGFFPGGAAWLCQHLWEHYAFSNDEEFLREIAYPLMKEASLFWIDYLIEDEQGYLVSSPSYSPEHGGISRGASMDHQIAWDLLNNLVKAGEILGDDEGFLAEAKSVRDRILPPAVGHWGQLQEWKEDVDDPENKHRHVSHLYALHPGKQVTVEQTPELAKAAQVSLEARGDGGTGWSLAWKVNFHARLKNGEKAHQLFRRLLRPTGMQGTDMMDGGGSYPNLLCAHPPFQLDGNMGGCAGIAEMLLQSHSGTIHLLPAIPQHWQNGSVSGLKARGNFEVDIRWENGSLTEVQIRGAVGAGGTLLYGNDVVDFTIPSGGTFTLSD